MPDHGRETPTHELSLGSAFPRLWLCRMPATLDPNLPASSARNFADLIAELLHDDLARNHSVRLVRSFPALLALQHDPLGHDDFARVGRYPSACLRRSGVTSWVSVLESTIERLSRSGDHGTDSFLGLVQLMVDRTFECVGSGIRSGLLQQEQTDDARPSLADLEIRKGPSNLLDPRISHETPIGDLLPELRKLHLSQIPPGLLPVRLSSRIPPDDWEGLLERTLADLFSITNIGRNSIEVLWDRLSRMARETRATIRSNVPVVSTALGPRLTASDSLVAFIGWAQAERGASTIGDVLGPIDTDVPQVVQALWEEASTETLPPYLLRPRPTDLLAELLSHASELAGAVLTKRHNLRTPRVSLGDLGEEFGVTRERVRQVEARFLQAARVRLAAPGYWALAARVDDLHRVLGAACRIDCDRYTEAFDSALRDVPADQIEVARALLGHLAGPYRFDSGWILTTPQDPPLLARLLLEDGSATRDQLEERAGDLGIHIDQVQILLDEFAQTLVHEGLVLRLQATIGDLAVSMLRHAGEPQGFERLWAVLQHKSPNERSLRNALFADARLQRTRKNEWALRDWGMREYTTIHELMLEEIDRAGGTMHVDALKETLLREFGISSVSVQMISDRPLFVVEDNFIRQRTTELYVPPKGGGRVLGLRETAHDGMAWRLLVDHDLLRGSARKAPESLMTFLGIPPGDRRAVSSDAGPLQLSWPPAGQPFLGSTRDQLTALEARLGDTLVLLFRAQGASEVRVVPMELFESEPIEAVALSLGAPTEAINVDALEALAVELNVVAGGRRSKLTRCRAALVEIGESDLAEVLAYLVG